METAEHNSKIAEYMGAIWMQDDYEKWGYFFPDKSPNYNPYQSKESLKYHKSWDWLMPVVQKILAEETKGPCTFKEYGIRQNIQTDDLFRYCYTAFLPG